MLIFYREGSTLTWAEAGAPGVVVDNLTAIQAEIYRKVKSSLFPSMNYCGDNFKVDILSMDSHDSRGAGIVILVTGFLLDLATGGKTKFVHTFFLARQEKGYFVLNDIFRPLEEAPQTSSCMITDDTSFGTGSEILDTPLQVPDVVAEPEMPSLFVKPFEVLGLWDAGTTLREVACAVDESFQQLLETFRAPNVIETDMNDPLEDTAVVDESLPPSSNGTTQPETSESIVLSLWKHERKLVEAKYALKGSYLDIIAAWPESPSPLTNGTPFELFRSCKSDTTKEGAPEESYIDAMAARDEKLNWLEFERQLNLKGSMKQYKPQLF